MITLETGQTLRGIAGTATAATYTVMGDEVGTGGDTFKVLAQGQLATSIGTLYTVPASTQTLIKTISIANATGSNISGVRLYVGGTAGTNLICNLAIPANGMATYTADGWKVYDVNGQQQFIGNTGPSGTITVGTVSNIGTAGPPTVTNVGTAQAAVLNFGLQQGATGLTGAPGVVQTVTAGNTTLTAGGTAADPTLVRAAITGDVGIPAASNTSTLATVNSNVGTFGTATQVATVTVNAKGLVTAASNTAIAIAQSAVTNLTTDLAAKAPLASPTFTGVPTAPTAAGGTNTTQLATTAFVTGGLAGYVPTDGSYAAVSTDVLKSRVTLDANPRFTLNTDGSMEWGDGTSTADTTFGRLDVNVVGSTSGARFGAGVDLANANGVTALAGMGGTGATGDKIVLFGGGTQGSSYGIGITSGHIGMFVPNVAGSGVVIRSAQGGLPRVGSGATNSLDLVRLGAVGPSGASAINIGPTGGDTVLYRVSAGIFGTNSPLYTNVGSTQVGIGATGPGSTPALSLGQSGDVQLYRSTTATARLNSALIVDGQINASTNVTFTGVSAPTHAAGKLVYDTDNESLTFFNNDANVALNIGQEVWLRAKNNTGVTIPNGAVVAISGVDAGVPTIVLADADLSTALQVVGVATEAIATGTVGHVTTRGIVRNLNTSSYAAGAALYLSSTAGALTTTAPVTPASYTIKIGYASTIHASTGTIYVDFSSTTIADKNKLNGMWYDIVADGGADRTGVVDATAIIQAAINAVAAGGGGVVYIPIGSYKVSSAITITGNFVTVRGASRVGSKIVPTHTTGNVFTVSGIFNRFEYIRIEPTSFTARTSGYALEFTSTASNCGAQWVDILGMWSAVRATGQLCRLEDMNIRECGYGAINGCIILIDSFTDQYISKIVSDNGTVGPNAPMAGFSGIRITNLSSLLMSDCQIIHCGIGMDVSPASTNTIPSIYCMNTFFDQGTYGARFTPGTGNIYRCRFLGVWFSGNSVAGVQLNGTSINGVDFIGCEFYGAPSQPIGIDAAAATEWAVRASRFAGNSTAAIRTTAGATHSFSITDCIIGTVSGVSANAQGINVQAGTYKRYQILDNRGLESNTTPGIIDLGTVAAADQKNVNNNMGTAFSGVGGAIVANAALTTTDTLLTRMPIPANGISVGQVFKVTIFAALAAAGTPSVRLRLGTAGTTADAALITHAPVMAAAASGIRFEMLCTIRTIGATGTAGVVSQNTLAGIVPTATNSTQVQAVPTINTTVANFLSVTASTSASTLTVHSCVLEML